MVLGDDMDNLDESHWLGCATLAILPGSTPGPCTCRQIVEGMKFYAFESEKESVRQYAAKWRAKELKKLDRLGR